MESAKRGEERSCTGRCKPRGEDRGDERVGGIETGNMLDCGAGKAYSCRRRLVPVVGWREVGIHVTAANECALAMGEADGGEEGG